MEDSIMLCKTDYAARVGTITLDAGEDLDLVHLDLRVQHLVQDPAGLWAVELVIEPNVMSFWTEALRQRRFIIVGSESRDAKTFMKLRRNLQVASQKGQRSAFVNPDLAVPAPVKEPTSEEKLAVSELNARLAVQMSGSDARVAAIERDAAEIRAARDGSPRVKFSDEAIRFAAHIRRLGRCPEEPTV
jgi:hypothetical protein